MVEEVSEKPSRLALGARVLVFCTLFGFMHFTPFYQQVLGHDEPWARDWVMFNDFGLDVCDVRYAIERPDGSRTPIDRYETLHYEDWRKAPKSVRKIKDRDGVNSVGRKLCHALPKGTDLRATARCASRKGWKTVERGEKNLCERS